MLCESLLLLYKWNVIDPYHVCVAARSVISICKCQPATFHYNLSYSAGLYQAHVLPTRCPGREAHLCSVKPRLTKIIRSRITFVSRNVISRRFL
jgi:hypothetical protein